MKKPSEIPAAKGKLGILLPGMGAVGTTFIAGCLLARRGLAAPVGSLTQMGDDSPRQAHRWPQPGDSGPGFARRARRPRVRGLGSVLQ